MGTPTWALTSFKVTVGSGCTALARIKAVVVHAETHGAAGVAPFEAGIDEGAINSFGLGLPLDQPGARYDQCLGDVAGDPLAEDERGGDAKVL
ncbi:hypothetical protein D9M71_726650 [compost metagenome]